jgi:uncharacterized iron-regulated protein
MDWRGGWIDGRSGAAVAPEAALERLASARVVLLGESHDRLADHLWQAAVVAGFAERGAAPMVGFEMFPRRVQPVLDAWSSGALDLDAFVAQSRWAEVWGFDPALYRPLLDLCCDRRLPMIALNCDRPLVSLVGRDGWQALPEEERSWLTPAAPALPDYRRYLFEITGGVRPGRAAQAPEDPAFDRFVRAQQVWDRAFACAIAEALGRNSCGPVVGIIGRGHLEYGFGTPWQLADLGITDVVIALPEPPDAAIVPSDPPIADLVCRHPQPQDEHA